MLIAGVIVTYNRKELLLKSLKCLKNQTRKLDRIFIIDNNSTDKTYEYIQHELNDSIEYIKLNENLGGSEGFYQGIKGAYEQGFEYIWGMDDDAFAASDALEKILIQNNKKENLCFASNCNADFGGYDKDNCKSVDRWMFVGFFIPRIIVSKIGLPRRDFFIYHDDSEYARRIIEAGYEILKVKDSIIEHNDFGGKGLYENSILGIKFKVIKMPDWKLYYYIRNNILMEKKYTSKYWKVILITIPKAIGKLMIVNKKQVKIATKGYFDGLCEKSGKIISP